MKKYSLDEKYAIYKRWYREQEIKLSRKGETMFSPMYSKMQFRNVYDETKYELKMLTDSGNRKGVGNVYQYMTREQAYPISYGMEKGLRKLYKEAGEEVNFNRFSTYEEIKNNTPQSVWDLIKYDYDNMLNQGVKSTDAKAIIAQMYFGSL